MHHEISDEAAAQLSELLNDPAVAFDGQYFAQIIRYYDKRRENERPWPMASPAFNHGRNHTSNPGEKRFRARSEQPRIAVK